MSAISDAVDSLVEKVTALKAADAAAITLMAGLAEQIRTNANQPTRLIELADAIDAMATTTNAAINANTV